jgi:transcriptional regulator with XRE-family HTH domain
VAGPCVPHRRTCPAPDGQDHPYLREFGLRLKLLRVRSGMTQEELADRAGMHRTFIGLLERGESGTNVERLVDLAHALGVEPAELLPPAPSRA